MAGTEHLGWRGNCYYPARHLSASRIPSQSRQAGQQALPGSDELWPHLVDTSQDVKQRHVTGVAFLTLEPPELH